MTQRANIELHLDAVWVIMNPKVKAENPCSLYGMPDGGVLRTLTDGRTMDVFEKRGAWLRVTNTGTIYWVRQDQVTQI